MRINSRKRLAFFVFIWVGFVFISTLGIVRVYNFVRKSPLWQVKTIQVEGLKRISKDEVLSILDLPSGVSIWDVNLAKLENRLSNHPWIEKAIVKWRFPGVVSVTVVERYPVAILCCNICLYVDEKGRLFSSVDRLKLSHDDIPWFDFCPVESGKIDRSYVVPSEILKSFSTLMQEVRKNFDTSWREIEILYSQESGFVINYRGIKAFVGANNIADNVKKLHYIVQRLEMLGREGVFREVDIRYMRWSFVR